MENLICEWFQYNIIVRISRQNSEFENKDITLHFLQTVKTHAARVII
jgi:hypothetical protein